MTTGKTPPDLADRLGQIIARAWSDPDFKRRLIADPAAIGREYGIPTPPGVQIRVVEDTPQVRHFILPLKPDNELSDESLDRVAGGAGPGGSVSMANLELPGGGVPGPQVGWSMRY
ncbi:MAG TPA: NHLP leader peptide family RiPP precursor [Thermoanaerobaculia bacterium]|nr:NHLP leader peptide family RiPP precursor [Thermoanaerobaculia bacterium]HQR66977.1 NHLP leader peptide family RiPP precursor [Thermoanaerobaculia bacterium]